MDVRCMASKQSSKVVHWKQFRGARCGSDCGRGHNVNVKLAKNKKNVTCKTCLRLEAYKSPFKVHLANNRRRDKYGEYPFGICGVETCCVDDTTFNLGKVTCKCCIRIFNSNA